MRHLILFRHAKSSWTSSAKNDHARPLTTRGIKAALRMGHWLSDKDMVPDRILCSSAKRARETLKLSRELWHDAPKAQFHKSLYLASADGVRDVIVEHGGDAQRLLVVGHNPDLQELTLKLADQKSTVTRDIIGKFPTGAMAILQCDIDNWADLKKNCATLISFMRPRALE